MSNRALKHSKSFGKRLREYRLQKHWSLGDLSKKTDVDKGALSRIENELVTPSMLSIQKITDVIPQMAEQENA